jgi:hypothetical protein
MNSILLFLFFLVFPSVAFAYLDPGTGSYIIQIVLAGLFGVLFAVRTFWTNIKLFFMKIFNKSTSKQNDNGKKS